MEKDVKKKAKIAKGFQIPPNILYRYLKKNKEKILNGMTNENWKDRKREIGPENAEVYECVLKWFKQARDKKETNKISFKSGRCESVSVDGQAAGVWKSEVRKMIEETPDKDIFNVDEIDLLYKCTPDKTL